MHLRTAPFARRLLLAPSGPAAAPRGCAGLGSSLLSRRWATSTAGSPYRNPAVNRIAELFQATGDGEYIGEPISQREHAIQCGMHAERAFPRDKEIAVAAFLHDVGHMIGLKPDLYAEVTKGTDLEHGIGRMDDCGIVAHERIGANFALQLGFSPRVASLIGGHVAAKRYLCATQPQYLKNLSEASKVTLRHQGGPMSEAECREYEEEGMLHLHLKMRYFDEIAKDPDCTMKPVEYFLTLADDVLADGKQSASA